MTIGELAARFGLATHVLRHWEDAGLLRPRRDSAGHRRYQDDDAEAVAMILMGQGVGLSLAEIGALATAAPDRATRHGLLRAHRDQLRERIIRTQAALDTLEHALECEAEDFRTCPHFRAHLAHAVRPETDPVSRPQPTLSEGILPIWQKARR
ncbi:MerR family transcriptional regulator [Nocardia huaxiensis]|uniref:MerR family transcriptional regulator n=2 Tax=Nocardia huaxiensis TaxID=2755382 RepID=A0A7D6ZV52_9NOCA|nr:MerR family transcriptional regulator [Nocardia huaxiensis]